MKWINLLAALLSISCFAQDTLEFWIDANDVQTKEKKANQKRKAWEEDGVWRVLDFSLDGQLQMSASYHTDSFKIKTGAFETWYDNGQKSLESYYLENELVGEYKSWHKDGNLDMVGTYADDFERETSDDPENQEPADPFIDTDSLSIKIGTWTYYHRNGQPSAVEEYDDNGKLKSVNYFEPNGDPSPEDAVIDRLPEFPGGEIEMIKFLSKHVMYPKKERRAKVEGKVVIYFVINENGYVSEAEVTKSVTPRMDAEALRVINSMPQWSPGRQRNRNVKVGFNQPIIYKMRR